MYNRNKYWKFFGPVDWFRKIFSPNDNIMDYYLIDRECNVYSEYSGFELTQIVTENGYKAVNLNTKNGNRIQRRVHRLGMFTFCYFPGCENLEVDHLDGNKFNNNISNLEWVTGKENVQRAINNGLRKEWSGSNNPKSVINKDLAFKICELALKGESDKNISEKLNISIYIVKSIVQGKTWNINGDIIKNIKEIRHPIILSIEQKHQICKLYQDLSIEREFGFGKTKEFVEKCMKILNIDINESTYRICKRLLYRYQDQEITNLYNY